jgi:endonuclease/exonuclease/phosphatase family metal-dependent hydrolase
MGDLNLNYSAEEIKRISNNTLINMTDTGAPYAPGDYTFPSYPSNAPDIEGVIDYIFATNCSVIDHHIVTDVIPGTDTAAEFGSDHRPVVSTLRFT